MVQGLKIHFPMQGTWIQSLLREDSTGQLNLCTTTTGSEYHDYQSLYALEPILSNKRSTAWEVWALQLRSPSLISTRESLHTATKTQRSQKKKNKIFSHEAKEVLMINIYHSKFSSVQLLSRVRLFAIPWTAACQASLSITNCRSLPKLMPIKSVMPSNHLILCCPLLLPPSIFPSIRVFSNESALCVRWQKYWSFSFNISPSNEHPGWISFRMDWLDLLGVQVTLKSLL